MTFEQIINEAVEKVNKMMQEHDITCYCITSQLSVVSDFDGNDVLLRSTSGNVIDVEIFEDYLYVNREQQGKYAGIKDLCWHILYEELLYLSRGSSYLMYGKKLKVFE